MKVSFASALRRVLIALIPVLITYHVLLFYGFIANTIFYILLAVAFIAYLYMDWKNALVLSCSLLGATVLLNVMLSFVRIDDRIYYREHERYTVYNGDLQGHAYKKKVDVTLKVPFGDLYAVGAREGIEIEPRTVRFQTDSLGFRNIGGYRGQQYVLVGDSFIAGNGSSQENMLASVLKDTYGIDAYTLGYPAGIPEYVKFIRYFESKYKNDFKVLLFVFEGNDFPDSFARRQFILKKRPVKAFFDSYRAFFKETVLYRYTFSLAAKGSKRTFTARVFTVGGHRTGDFDEYIGVTERPSYKFPESGVPALSGVRERIDHIFFIPTKFRVYYPFLGTGNEKPLPNVQWEALKALSERLKIPCTDLTGPLVAESAELLKKGEFTFWKDDSHWNRNGVAVAARVVAEEIKAGK